VSGLIIRTRAENFALRRSCINAVRFRDLKNFGKGDLSLALDLRVFGSLFHFYISLVMVGWIGLGCGVWSLGFVIEGVVEWVLERFRDYGV
jgi:hypothetical protein